MRRVIRKKCYPSDSSSSTSSSSTLVGNRPRLHSSGVHHRQSSHSRVFFEKHEKPSMRGVIEKNCYPSDSSSSTSSSSTLVGNRPRLHSSGVHHRQSSHFRVFLKHTKKPSMRRVIEKNCYPSDSSSSTSSSSTLVGNRPRLHSSGVHHRQSSHFRVFLKHTKSPVCGV